MTIAVRPTSSGGATSSPLADRKRALWVPTGVTDESFTRLNTTATAVAMATGTMRVVGGLVVPAGVTVTSLWCIVNAASTTLTNGWAALIRASDLSVLAKSADTGAANWTTGVLPKPFTVSWAAAAETAVYVGFVQVGTALATLAGTQINGNAAAAASAIGGTSNTGLTDPTSLGATATAVAGTSPIPWAGLTWS